MNNFYSLLFKRDINDFIVKEITALGSSADEIAVRSSDRRVMTLSLLVVGWFLVVFA